jgi:hypothetical protein
MKLEIQEGCNANRRMLGKVVRMFGATPHQCWTTVDGPDLVDFVCLLEQGHRIKKNRRWHDEENKLPQR